MQRLEGGEGMSHVSTWEKNMPEEHVREVCICDMFKKQQRDQRGWSKGSRKRRKGEG